MTGEMSKSEVTEEEYPVHFYVARHLQGTVEPFNHYQGPYISTKYHQLWLIEDNEQEYIFYWYDSVTEMQSYEFEDICYFRNLSDQRLFLHRAFDAAIHLIYRYQCKLTKLVSLKEKQ